MMHGNGVMILAQVGMELHFCMGLKDDTCYTWIDGKEVE